MLAIKRFTDYVLKEPYLILRHSGATVQQQMTIYDASRWVDCIASIVVLVIILFWVTRQLRDAAPSLSLRILRWAVILLLLDTAIIVATRNLWRIFPVFNPLRSYWIDGFADISALAAWPVVFVLLFRIRLNADSAAWRLVTPFALPSIVGYTYWTLNYALIVKFLGCGCNLTGFNANDFSAMVFLALFLVILVMMVIACRPMRLSVRIAYLATGIPIVAMLCWTRLSGCMWR